jgi:hypothetical protein
MRPRSGGSADPQRRRHRPALRQPDGRGLAGARRLHPRTRGHAPPHSPAQRRRLLRDRRYDRRIARRRHRSPPRRRPRSGRERPRPPQEFGARSEVFRRPAMDRRRDRTPGFAEPTRCLRADRSMARAGQARGARDHTKHKSRCAAILSFARTRIVRWGWTKSACGAIT